MFDSCFHITDNSKIKLAEYSQYLKRYKITKAFIYYDNQKSLSDLKIFIDNCNNFKNLIPVAYITSKKNPLREINHITKCNIKYVTYRGDWFLKTWKGSINKSGGLTTNIGIHLFDLLTWIFGDYVTIKVKKNDDKTNIGSLKFKRAHVEWLISISDKYLNKNRPTERSIREFSFDNKNLELSDNFTNMHVLSYKKIINGDGFMIKEVEKSLYITEKLRKLSRV